jgi:hypothetical protein
MNTAPITVIAAVNDSAVLSRDLQKSPCIAEGRLPLRCYRGHSSAGEAYDMGMTESASPLLVFAHQDVYLPKGWTDRLEAAVRVLDAVDPDWAVLGIFGLDKHGKPTGHVWSSGLQRVLGKPFDGPVEATCLDELLLVVRRESGVQFDQILPGFHLYGTDIVLASLVLGRKSYIMNLPVIHNSRPIHLLREDYFRARRYMRRKWRGRLPWPTLILPLTKTDLPVWRYKVMRRTRNFLFRFASRPQQDVVRDPQKIAARLGF